MSDPLVADTGGLLRALARRPDGRAAWPEYEGTLRDASVVIVPALILAEDDDFLRSERTAVRMRDAKIAPGEYADPCSTRESSSPCLGEDGLGPESHAR